jgi:hypothetical protein
MSQMADSASLKLVTKRDAVAVEIQAKLLDIAAMAEKEPLIGMAVVLLRGDGTSWVSTIGYGNRVLLLGAITDLQYTVAKDGDGK